MARGKQRKGNATQPSGSGGAKHPPGTPAMTEAWRLFDGGDKYAARARAKAVLEKSPSEAEAAEAHELLERTRLPRFPLIVAGVFASLIVLLILLAVIRY